MYSDAFAFCSYVHEMTGDKQNVLGHGPDQLPQLPIFV